MKCNCHPNSPFHWMHNKRPSIFVKDIAFRAKGIIVTEYESFLSDEVDEERKSKEIKERELTAYKQFGIFARAHPNIKPVKNKHEI